MSLLRSKSTRVYSVPSSGPAVDVTEAMRTWGGPTALVSFASATAAVYIGRAHKFNNRYLSIKNGAVASAQLVAEYWNGSTWNAFENFSDETDGLQASGFLTWEERPEWLKATVSQIMVAPLAGTEPLYWIRLRLLVAPVAAVELEAVKCVFSDDRLLTSIHPEILQYLPAGKTNFMEQHELAKDAIVAEMIKKGVIAYEEQIKDVEQWLLCASYKCASIILAAIPGDERLAAVKKEMDEQYNVTRPELAASLDTNQSENLDAAEKDPQWHGSISMVRR